jgi:hypothetical protein
MMFLSRIIEALNFKSQRRSFNRQVGVSMYRYLSDRLISNSTDDDNNNNNTALLYLNKNKQYKM